MISPSKELEPPEFGWFLLAATVVLAAALNLGAFLMGRQAEADKFAPLVEKYDYLLQRDTMCIVWRVPGKGKEAK